MKQKISHSKEMVRKFLAFFMVFAIIMCFQPIQASADSYEGTCSLSVRVGIANASFKVPYGKTLNITWEFIDKDDVPYGWQLLVNGEKATSGSTIDGIKINSLPTMAATCTSGKPSDLTFSPTQEQCESGSATAKTEITALTKEQCEFELLFVDKNTNQEVGKYEKDGKGYHTSQSYGKFTISATSTNTIRNYVTKNLSGYRIYTGVPGNVDKQEKTLIVGKDGVTEKSITMYVEVNHSTLTDLHVQPVKFTYADKTVLEKDVPLKSNYSGTYTGAVSKIELDMSTVAEELEKLGYKIDPEKTYAVDCDNYTHSPAVSEVEVLHEKHIYTSTIKTPATTERDGKISEECGACGYTNVITTIPKADSFNLAKQTYIYDGKSKKPAVTVKDAQGNILSEGKDYKVAYKKYLDAGTATVSITGTGNYDYSKNITYTIKKATPTVTLSGKAKSVKYKTAKKKSTYTSAVAVSGAKGTKSFYKVCGSSKLSISKTTGKIKVKKGTKKGTYKIKVKVRSAATRNYNAGMSAAKTIKVKVK